MKSPKLVLGLSVAAGLLAVVLVQLQLRSDRGEQVTVLRATRAAGIGETLGDSVEPVALPGGSLFPNVLKVAPTVDLAQLVRTTPLAEPIALGEIVLYRHLETSVQKGVRADLPDGMKAIALAVREDSSVGFLVRPGDLVDVLAAVPGRMTAIDPGTAVNVFMGSPASQNGVTLEIRPIVQAVKVLAVGPGDGDGGTLTRYSAVTLGVTMEEAQKLVYVRDVLATPMTLVLRGGADQARQSPRSGVSLFSPEFDRIGNSKP